MERKEKEAAAAITVGFLSPSLDDGGDDESLIFPHAQRQDKARRRRRRLGPRRPRLSGCCPIRTLSFVALPLLPPRADVGLAVRLPETAAVDDASLIFHFAPNDSRTSIRQGPDQEEDEFTFFYMANFRPSPVRRPPSSFPARGNFSAKGNMREEGGEPQRLPPPSPRRRRSLPLSSYDNNLIVASDRSRERTRELTGAAVQWWAHLESARCRRRRPRWQDALLEIFVINA